MTQQSSPFDEIVSYVRHQAAKGPEHLDSLMERTQADWARCLEGMSEAQATFRAGKEWTVKEILGHAIGSTRLVNRQVAEAAQGVVTDSPFGEAEELRNQAPREERRPVEELRREMTAALEETRALVRRLAQDNPPDVTFKHPFFGSLRLMEWIAFQRVHSLDHIQQIEKVKADPAYPRG